MIIKKNCRTASAIYLHSPETLPAVPPDQRPISYSTQTQSTGPGLARQLHHRLRRCLPAGGFCRGMPIAHF